MKFFYITMIFLLSTLASAGTKTEQDFGDYIVYFNVLNSSFLLPEVASQYNIVRSRSSAIINIAVQKKTSHGDNPVNATLTGHFSNIIGQMRSLDFVRVQEGKAIYYLSDFRVADSEPLVFNIDIHPDDTSKSFNLKFTRKVFVD